MLGVSGSRQRLRLLHREALTTPHPGVWRSDAIIVNFAEFDLTFWVDDESTAQCEARAFGHHTKAATDGASRVAGHRVLILLMVSDESCQALWAKCVSVETA